MFVSRGYLFDGGQRRLGLLANRDDPSADHQRHAQDNEQRRRPIPECPVDQCGENDDRVDEGTNLDRRRVAVRENDENLAHKQRQSDTDQVDRCPRPERFPIDQGERSDQDGGEKKVVEEDSGHRLGRSQPADGHERDREKECTGQRIHGADVEILVMGLQHEDHTDKADRRRRPRLPSMLARRKTAHAITGIHSGALNVSRIAFVSGISVIATNSEYQAAVPVAARKICKPILSVRSEARPRWRVTGMMNRRQIRFWNSRTTAVDVSSSVAFTRALITAVQKNDSELRAAPNAKFSGI